MLLYKDNQFHFSNISFCLPDNVYLNTALMNMRIVSNFILLMRISVLSFWVIIARAVQNNSLLKAKMKHVTSGSVK